MNLVKVGVQKGWELHLGERFFCCFLIAKSDETANLSELFDGEFVGVCDKSRL